MLVAFSLPDGRYGIDCRAVVAVAPLASLQSVAGKGPQAPEAMPGLLDYHGTKIPVIDLGRLLLGRPCAEHLSTRILIVSCGSGLAGLMVERADETLDLPAPPSLPGALPSLQVSRIQGEGTTAKTEKPLEIGRILIPLLRSALAERTP